MDWPLENLPTVSELKAAFGTSNQNGGSPLFANQNRPALPPSSVRHPFTRSASLTSSVLPDLPDLPTHAAEPLHASVRRPPPQESRSDLATPTPLPPDHGRGQADPGQQSTAAQHPPLLPRIVTRKAGQVPPSAHPHVSDPVPNESASGPAAAEGDRASTPTTSPRPSAPSCPSSPPASSSARSRPPSSCPFSMMIEAGLGPESLGLNGTCPVSGAAERARPGPAPAAAVANPTDPPPALSSSMRFSRGAGGADGGDAGKTAAAAAAALNKSSDPWLAGWLTGSGSSFKGPPGSVRSPRSRSPPGRTGLGGGLRGRTGGMQLAQLLVDDSEPGPGAWERAGRLTASGSERLSSGAVHGGLGPRGWSPSGRASGGSGLQRRSHSPDSGDEAGPAAAGGRDSRPPMLAQLRSTSEPTLLGPDGSVRGRGRPPGPDGGAGDGDRVIRRSGSEPVFHDEPESPPVAMAARAGGSRVFGRSWRAGAGRPGGFGASAQALEPPGSFRVRAWAAAGGGLGGGSGTDGAGGSGRTLTPPPLPASGSQTSLDSDIQRAGSTSRRSFAESRAGGSSGRPDPARPVNGLTRAGSRRSGGSGSGTAGSGSRGSGGVFPVGLLGRRRAALRSRAPPWDPESAARHGPVVRGTWARVTKALSWDQARGPAARAQHPPLRRTVCDVCVSCAVCVRVRACARVRARGCLSARACVRVPPSHVSIWNAPSLFTRLSVSSRFPTIAVPVSPPPPS
jgi:hypothetical protein